MIFINFIYKKRNTKKELNKRWTNNIWNWLLDVSGIIIRLALRSYAKLLNLFNYTKNIYGESNNLILE